MTHWQSPRYFAYFGISSSEPAILAELLAATLNQNAIVWRTSPASTELEGVVLDWVAELLGLPAGWHGHIEDTASTSTLVALAAARELAPGKRVVVASEHSHSSVEKAVKTLGLELRRTPVDDEFRLRPDALDLEGACAVVATVGHDVDGVGRSGARDRGSRASEPASGSTSTRHMRGRRWCARSSGGRSTASSARIRWSSTRTSGCSSRSTARCSGADARRRCARRSRSYPSTCGRSEEVESIAEYGLALGRRFRSLKLWAVLRCYGREGLQRLIREHVRLAELFESWVRAEPGWEVSAPRHFSLVCFRRDGSDEENEALLERVNASGEAVHLAHEARRTVRAAARDRSGADDGGRRAPRVGGAAPRGRGRLSRLAHNWHALVTHRSGFPQYGKTGRRRGVAPALRSSRARSERRHGAPRGNARAPVPSRVAARE